MIHYLNLAMMVIGYGIVIATIVSTLFILAIVLPRRR